VTPSRRQLIGAAAIAAAALRGGRVAHAQPAPPASAQPGSASPDAEPQRRQHATSDGVQLSLLSAGADRPGTPVLFVPGWSMPAELWRPQMARLQDTRPVAALDPRGHGESEAPAGGYGADRRAADLFEVLAGLARPAIVVAWSLAGIELLHGLPTHGDGAIAGVMLVDSSVGEGPAGRGDGVAAFRRRLGENRAAALADFARAIFRRPQSAARIDALVAAMSRVPLDASLEMLDWGLPRERLRATARGLRRPLRLAITPQYREQARLHAAARPATRVEVFEEAGHALFDDAPERFAALLARFCAEVDAGR